MMEAAGTLKCWCVYARLHGATTENIFGVRSVWCAKDKQQQLSHLYPQLIMLHSKHWGYALRTGVRYVHMGI